MIESVSYRNVATNASFANHRPSFDIDLTKQLTTATSSVQRYRQLNCDRLDKRQPDGDVS